MSKRLDNKKNVDIHRAIIKNKPILRQVYLSFYKELRISSLKKPVVELGSGGGFLKELYPDIVTSDVVLGEDIDKVFKAEKMPFKNSSIGAFVMLDTFHHIKNIKKALREMERCLIKGGKIIMVEPFNSLWGRFIFQHFHHERFDPKDGWEIKGKGRLSDANGALPWIIFSRDRLIFEKNFPGLKIIKIKPHTPFGYLVSGGLSKPQLLPTFAYNFIISLEKTLVLFNSFLGMFVTIEIKKK